LLPVRGRYEVRGAATCRWSLEIGSRSETGKILARVHGIRSREDLEQPLAGSSAAARPPIARRLQAEL
jgi:hypothetical protein